MAANNENDEMNDVRMSLEEISKDNKEMKEQIAQLQSVIRKVEAEWKTIKQENKAIEEALANLAVKIEQQEKSNAEKGEEE